MYSIRGGFYNRIRTVVLIFIWACASVVLGIEANFASILLPYDSDFIIFGLVVSIATVILTFTLTLRATPFIESLGFFVFSVLWVAMGGYSVDRIGGVQCMDLAGQQLNTGRNQTMSAEAHCKQMKVIMAFSWAEFSTILLMFLTVVALTIRARTHGAGSRVWNESISDLPWFGQWVGEDRQHYQPTYPMPGFPQSVGYPQTVGYPQPFTPLPGGMPARIVINAPPAGETLTLRPEDGYQQPVVRPGTYV